MESRNLTNMSGVNATASEPRREGDPMKSPRGLRTVGCLAVVAALAGCTGRIGDAGKGGTGPGVSAGAGGTAGGGAVAQTGTGAGASGAAAPASTGSGLGTLAPPTQAPANPGSVVLRRLNADEYDNTVRDLLGTTLTPGDSFPGDDLGAQFTTVGAALSLSPTYVQAYANAATLLIEDLFAAPAARQQTILTCDVTTGGDACARTIVTGFASKAFRRPAITSEVDSLMTAVSSAKTAGGTETDGLKAALEAVLVSPYFIFKPELDPSGATGPHRVSAYELATRLSYALWSTMPDATLISAAAAGQLSTDAQVQAQVERMLADSRASALLDEFAGNWLDFSTVESVVPDPTTFPNFTATIAHSMRLEARSFIRDYLNSNQPVSNMFTSGFTYIDANLAKQYGMSAMAGTANADGLWRVPTTGTQRIGLLTLGSILTTTSLSTRTSPVRRGDFIYERLLCGTIAAPPPNIVPLAPTTSMSLRQTLAAHRANPACAGCHNIMDPLGLGLENYDAVGEYRTMDGTFPVDASGTLTDGTMFTGAPQMSAALAQDPRFSPCMTQSFMTYAIGRLMNQPDDVSWANYLSHQAQATNGSLGAIIRDVILSDAFRSRQAASM
jgi:hypothetical protein